MLAGLVLFSTVLPTPVLQTVAPKWCAGWSRQKAFSSSLGCTEPGAHRGASNHRLLLDWRTACAPVPPSVDAPLRDVAPIVLPTRQEHGSEPNRGRLLRAHSRRRPSSGQHGISAAQRTDFRQDM